MIHGRASWFEGVCFERLEGSKRSTSKHAPAQSLSLMMVHAQVKKERKKPRSHTEKKESTSRASTRVCPQSRTGQNRIRTTHVLESA